MYKPTQMREREREMKEEKDQALREILSHFFLSKVCIDNQHE